MGQMIAAPTWWQELLEIMEVTDIQELAQKIRASFELPQWMTEMHDIKNYYLAPPAPRCIQQKAFLPPPDPMFPCWDIKRAIPEDHSLQYWAEKANLPTPGQPCLLVRCILELRKAMELYMSFSDEAILDGATSQEESLEDLTGVTIPGMPCRPLLVLLPEEPAEEPAPMEVTTKKQPLA